MIHYTIAPSSAPNVSFSTTTTSITVNWTAIPDANGYVVYFNDTGYDIIGNNNTSTILDEQIPGTSYTIRVWAYQDILGPTIATLATTDDGKQYLWYNYYITLL